MIFVSTRAQLRAKSALILIEQVNRLKRRCLLKTNLLLYSWFAIPLAVSYFLPPMPLQYTERQFYAYLIWTAWIFVFVYLIKRAAERKDYYPSSETHDEGFPVGYQPSFWQWQLYCDLRDDLKTISEKLGIWPLPSMAMKSFYPGHFGMVEGTERPQEPACVMLPTEPSFVQWGFSRRANCATLVHECGHIILSTVLWTRRFNKVYLIAAIPMSFVFANLAGQMAALLGYTAQEWQALSKYVFTFQLPLAAYLLYGFWGARILSRIHEYCCDAIAVAYGEVDGIVENLNGFTKFTSDWLARKSPSYQIFWHLVKRPYRAVFSTHPSNQWRIKSCLRYSGKGYGVGV